MPIHPVDRRSALTLTFADGDTRRRTLFVASAGEPVGLISVEGEVYTRK